MSLTQAAAIERRRDKCEVCLRNFSSTHTPCRICRCCAVSLAGAGARSTLKLISVDLQEIVLTEKEKNVIIEKNR